jgi:hypothetical protein
MTKIETTIPLNGEAVAVVINCDIVDGEEPNGLPEEIHIYSVNLDLNDKEIISAVYSAIEEYRSEHDAF